MAATPSNPHHAAAARFDGLTNLRDLGGRHTVHGRSIRRGMLFRSESLDYVTERDRAVLASLGIRSICDLRGARESALRPSRVPGAVHRPMPIETRFEEVTASSVQSPSGEIDAERMTRFMHGIYDALPRLAAPHLAGMIELLLDDARSPVLFHCTAGKDRTGFAAAVLLKLLGADWQDIEADYLATNAMWRPRFSLPPEFTPQASQVAMTVSPEYLARAFQVVETAYGGFERYLRDAVGVTPTVEASLRDRLLAPG